MPVSLNHGFPVMCVCMVPLQLTPYDHLLQLHYVDMPQPQQ